MNHGNREVLLHQSGHLALYRCLSTGTFLVEDLYLDQSAAYVNLADAQAHMAAVMWRRSEGKRAQVVKTVERA